MLFAEFDQGMVLRKGTDRHDSKIIRLVIGNPLIMKEMAKHVPDAGSYAPVTVLVDERADGVHLSYDRMASLLDEMRRSIPKHATLSVIRRIHGVQLEIRRSTLEKE